MNDIDTDWLDDMLEDHFPEYDDLTEETLTAPYQPEYQWKLSLSPHTLKHI